MKQRWTIEPSDVDKVKALVARQAAAPFVKDRWRCNVRDDKPEVGKAWFWKQMVGCLLTTQNKAGPDSPVTRFNTTAPFPLAFDTCAAIGRNGHRRMPPPEP